MYCNEQILFASTVWGQNKSAGLWLKALEKPDPDPKARGHPGKEKPESKETEGRMRRIVSNGRRITLPKEAICLPCNLLPLLACSLPWASEHKNSCFKWLTSLTLTSTSKVKESLQLIGFFWNIFELIFISNFLLCHSLQQSSNCPLFTLILSMKISCRAVEGNIVSNVPVSNHCGSFTIAEVFLFLLGTSRLLIESSRDNISSTVMLVGGSPTISCGREAWWNRRMM